MKITKEILSILLVSFLILLSGKLWLIYILMSLFVFGGVMFLILPQVKKIIQTNINILVTMLLGGLWHGSSALFIIWGGLNGFGIIAHKFWNKISPLKNSKNIFVKFFLIILTLSFISFTRIFFRSSDMNIVDTIFDRINNHFETVVFWKMTFSYKTVFLMISFDEQTFLFLVSVHQHLFVFLYYLYKIIQLNLILCQKLKRLLNLKQKKK